MAERTRATRSWLRSDTSTRRRASSGVAPTSSARAASTSWRVGMSVSREGGAAFRPTTHPDPRPEKKASATRAPSAARFTSDLRALEGGGGEVPSGAARSARGEEPGERRRDRDREDRRRGEHPPGPDAGLSRPLDEASPLELRGRRDGGRAKELADAR